MNTFKRKRIPAIVIAVVMMLSSITAFAIPANATSDTSLKSHLNIGYWLGGNGGTNKTLAQTDPGWDVINVSFIETKGTYHTPSLAMDLSAVYSGTESQQISAFKADIQTLKAQGKKIVISCGGQNGVVHLDDEEERDIFLNGIKDIIREYQFDGFDVDFEGSSISCMNPDKIGNLVTQQSKNLEYILRDLKVTFGDEFIISAAPEYCYVQGGAISTGNFGAFLPVLDACRDILTYIHPQYYNGFDGDFAWLQSSANAGEPFARVYSAEGYVRLSEMLITGFVTVDKGTFEGLRPDQVAFGVPARAGAGNGAQDVSVYASALSTLLAKYPTFRGIMTWSIGWDESGGNNFVNAIAPIIVEANGQITPTINAQTPVITGHPTDKSIGISDIADLTVVASVSKGVLSYQWYTTPTKTNTDGTPVNGATSTTYHAPTNSVGTSYYYCVVTNTDNSATGDRTAEIASNPVSVEISDNPLTNAAAPDITSQPSDKTVTAGSTATLSVAADVSHGTLSYQWYCAPSKANTGGTPINGAASASYDAPTSTVGTSYYYCVVTNTDNSVTGSNTAESVSNAVSVKVNAFSADDTWSPDAIYTTGDTVGYQSQTYLCKWWSQGDIPSEGGPWELQSDSNEYVPGKAYLGGDTVVYQEQTWRANWWTTSVPGSDNSWSQL